MSYESSPLKDARSLGLSREEAYRVRFQCPRQALADYQAVVDGRRGPVPPIVTRMADTAVAHLRRAVHLQLEMESRVACYRWAN